MSFCPDIYEGFFDTNAVKNVPPKKENPAYEKLCTLYIKTMYGDLYEVNNVYDYGYSEKSHHYWYTTVDCKHRYNYVRADKLLYFGLKEYCMKALLR